MDTDERTGLRILTGHKRASGTFRNDNSLSISVPIREIGSCTIIGVFYESIYKNNIKHTSLKDRHIIVRIIGDKTMPITTSEIIMSDCLFISQLVKSVSVVFDIDEFCVTKKEKK